MVSVKNPKEVEIRGDYNLVYHNDQLVAIILCSVEHTRRQRYQGGNRFLVYEYEAAKGYAITEEWDESPEEGDIKLAKYNGCWQSLRLHKVVGTRNTEESILVRVPASLIRVEQHSALTHPLNIKWSYSWHEYDTKDRVVRKVYLSDSQESCIHVEDIFLSPSDDKKDPKRALWRLAPTLQQMRRDSEGNWVYALRSYNGNILVHFESRGIYAWYKPDGTPLTYSDEGEWEHLWPKCCSHYDDDIDSILEWAQEHRRRRGAVDGDNSEPTDDPDGGDLTPRRIRRGRYGSRAERMREREAAKREASNTQAESSEE